MQKYLKIKTCWSPSKLALAAIVLFNGLPAPSYARLVDKIVATVGNDIVTLSQLKKFRSEARKAGAFQGPGGPNVKSLEKDDYVLDLIVKERLLEQAVKKQQLAATDDEVEVTINRIQKQNKINRVQLKQALETQGMTFETFRDNVRKQIEKQNLIQKEIKQKIQLTEQDLYSYYLSQSKDSKTGGNTEYRFSHILLDFGSHGGKEKTLELAKEVLKEIRGGTPFEKAAEKFSDDKASVSSGGDLGYFKQGTLDSSLENILKSLKVNEISAPVISGRMVHILKLTDRRSGSKDDFEAHKEEIRELLTQKEFDRQLELWFENQRQQAHVKTML